jgi:hypothetical protein
MTTASEYVEAIRTQQRAVRHATSLPLLVNGLAMVYLTSVEAVLVFVPFGFIAFYFAGAAFFLGVGLGVLGWRAGSAWLWAPGLVLMVVSPLVSLGTLANHAAFVGGGVGGMVICTVGLLVLSAVTFLRERRVAQPSPA